MQLKSTIAFFTSILALTSVAPFASAESVQTQDQTIISFGSGHSWVARNNPAVYFIYIRFKCCHW